MARHIEETSFEAVDTDRVRQLLSELGESDFERFKPPADLWGRIEAAIAAEPAVSPKTPPSRTIATGTVVEYWIDADDVVVGVGDAWAEFARDNDAPELVTLDSERTLWSYFDNDEARELWKLLVERVRALQTDARVPLRCDAPDARRWFEVTMTPEADGRVHFRSMLAFEEPRPPVSLLDPRTERDDDLEPVPVCSWCGRGEHASQWLDVEDLVQTARLLERTSMPAVSYGICASCRDEMSVELLVPAEVTGSDV